VATIKPILLLADSQLLFFRGADGPVFGDLIRAWLETPPRQAQAAYLGASNGDLPEFYELFVSAMAEVGIRDCRMIPTVPDAEDLAFLAGAELVLLAGGDVRRGWEAFTASGLNDRLVELHLGGAILVGVSAGAVQLGLFGWDEEAAEPFPTLRLVPFILDVHDEPSWARLSRLVARCGEHVKGLGIPSGAGLVYHPDDVSLEPLRHPAVELVPAAPADTSEDGVRQALLLPGAA
jgi:hypothetical protein